MLEADFEESRVVDLMFLVYHVLEFIILICVCIKSNLITLEPCNIFG